MNDYGVALGGGVHYPREGNVTLALCGVELVSGFDTPELQTDLIEVEGAVCKNCKRSLASTLKYVAERQRERTKDVQQTSPPRGGGSRAPVRRRATSGEGSASGKQRKRNA